MDSPGFAFIATGWIWVPLVIGGVFLWLEFGPARVGMLLRALRLHGRIDFKYHRAGVNVSNRVFLKAVDKARSKGLVALDSNGVHMSVGMGKRARS